MEPDALAQGSIVWADVADPNGHIKRRPVVILTATHEIVLPEPVVAAAISTSYRNPAPENVVEIPWNPRGHSVTRLRKRSAVVCDWRPFELRPSQIIEVKGRVPTRYLLEILQNIDRYFG